MYYLNKIVGWVASPLGLLFLGMAAAAVFRRRGKLAKWLVAAPAVFLWIMSCGITTRLVGTGLESAWEREGVMHGSLDALPPAGVILVLGGGTGAHDKCKAPELFSGADRVWQGARAYNALKSRVDGLKVVCTGGGCEHSTVPFLVDLGVPREAIAFSEEPRNTEEEARYVKGLLGAGDGSGGAKVLLVTSAWHMSRALSLFKRQGLDVEPVPADFEMSYIAEHPVEPGDFFPSADALLRNTSALKEWVARFGYAVLGR